jgi:hypothetical protein
MSNPPNPTPTDPAAAIQAGVPEGAQGYTSPTPPAAVEADVNRTPTPKNNYAWIGFFVFIVIASVGVTAFMIWYSLSIQLTPEQLESAWKLWEEKGPKSYNMVYTKQLNDDSKVIIYGVKVRNAKVIEVKQGGEFLEKPADRLDDPRIYHSMDALFRDAKRFQDLDAKPGAKKVYVTAIFDDKNGAMLRYVRRVMGTNERVEIRVELEAVK